MHKNPSSGKRYSHCLGEEIFYFYAVDMWEAVFSWGKRYSKRILLPEEMLRITSSGNWYSLVGKGILSLEKVFLCIKPFKIEYLSREAANFKNVPSHTYFVE